MVETFWSLSSTCPIIWIFTIVCVSHSTKGYETWKQTPWDLQSVHWDQWHAASSKQRTGPQCKSSHLPVWWHLTIPPVFHFLHLCSTVRSFLSLISKVPNQHWGVGEQPQSKILSFVTTSAPVFVVLTLQPAEVTSTKFGKSVISSVFINTCHLMFRNSVPPKQLCFALFCVLDQLCTELSHTYPFSLC